MASPLRKEFGNLGVIGRSPIIESHPEDQSDRHRWTISDIAHERSVPMSRENLKTNIDDVEFRELSPPDWLGEFADLATRAFHSQIPIAPVGCHFHRNDEAESPQWEVTLFVSSTEIFGGALDGQSVF